MGTPTAAAPPTAAAAQIVFSTDHRRGVKHPSRGWTEGQSVRRRASLGDSDDVKLWPRSAVRRSSRLRTLTSAMPPPPPTAAVFLTWQP